MSQELRAVSLAIALAGVVSLTAGQETAPGVETISQADLRRDVSTLASDEMSGRLVGTPGNEKAAAFIAGRFQELGLEPVGSDGYLDRFGLVTATLGAENALSITVDDVSQAGELGVDFHPERYSGSGHVTGSVVFVGYGISAPELGHDDYREVDVEGRIALVLDHEPGENDPDSPFDGTFASEHSRAVRKALEAQRRGAVAVLFLPDLHNHPSARPVRSTMNSTWPTQPARVPAYQLAAWVSQLDIPALRVSVEYAKGLLDASETLDTLSETADTVDGAPGTVRADVVVQIIATVDRTTVPSHNVVGLLEGSDPALREEWVILCAHYDHEGTTAQGIFRGADDDASGVAGLLEIAEAYVTAGREGRSPRRSILFAAWNAEERGLLGSWAYAERPLTPLERTVAVLNMDMIGRHEEVPENGGGRFRGLTPQTAESNHDAVNLLGYTYSADLRAATETANTDDALELRFRYDDNPSNLLRRSDHWPFLFSGVPALFVHTGLHPDYHTERDTPDKLDYEKMSRVVGLVHQLSWNLAQANGRPAFLPRVRAR